MGRQGDDKPTIVGPGCKFTGDLALEGQLIIEGHVEGELHVKGSVELLPGARLTGHVSATDLRVADGAECRGRVRVRPRE